MTPRPVRSLLAVGALVGLLVSCSGSDDGADTTDGTSVDATVEPTTTIPTTPGPTTTVPTTTGDVVVTGAPEESIDPDTALANELMSATVEANLGLPKEQADCAAVFIVEALGADTLIVDGELVDLDTLPAEAQQAAAAAIAEAVPDCGITVSSVAD